jgi:hypothetical protein
MDEVSTVIFPQTLRIRCPRGMPNAVATAARRHHTTGPEYVRQALLRVLREDGLKLLPDGRIDEGRG